MTTFRNHLLVSFTLAVDWAPFKAGKRLVRVLRADGSQFGVYADEEMARFQIGLRLDGEIPGLVRL